jgi:hypothetical protein
MSEVPDTGSWFLTDKEKLTEVYTLLTGNACEKFRGTLSCFWTDTEVVDTLELIDRSENVVNAKVGEHLMLTDGRLQKRTIDEFNALKAMVAEMDAAQLEAFK